MTFFKRIQQLFRAPERLADAIRELSLSLEMIDQNRHREITVQEAMNTLIEKLRSDSIYRLGWQQLIAIYFVDKFESNFQLGEYGRPNRDELVKCANEAAERFLQQLTADDQ